MATNETLKPVAVPQSSIGAPLPHVFADEQTLFIAYLVEAPDPDFDGTNPRLMTPADGDDVVAILTAEYYLAFQFGPPNDEAIEGHRLYSLGLRPYAAFEVLNSSWIETLEKANRVHEHHKPERFFHHRHFILTFQDTTLEFLAENFSVNLRKGAVLPALIEVVSSWSQAQEIKHQEQLTEVLEIVRAKQERKH